MYADPRHIRDHEVKVRLNEDELHLLEALAQYNQTQRAVLARELILDALAKLRGSDRQMHLTA
jgi:uncharacterized protein YeeX (DUF496 family)